ncbi:MAG: SDR family oxidoreductase [Polynucleobacter sp.]|nr:SDR family oxidoreductase [Polynucleobacter sp.]
MKIGINGASGHLGQGVVSHLQSRKGEHQIIGISRSPENIPAPTEGRKGDYDQPETLATAYAGLDRLLLIPSSDLRPGKRAEQTQAGIDAALAAGVKHIFYMSAAGTHAIDEPDIFASYYATEQYLIKHAPTWTILRMSYYAESFAQEAQMAIAGGTLVGLGENKVSFASRDDMAAAAAGALTSEGHEGAIYTLTGPAAVSGAERAAVVAEVSGKPFQYAPLSEDALRGAFGQAGLPEAFAEVMLSMQRHFARGGYNIVSGDIEWLSGIAPRSLKEAIAPLFA